VIFSQEQRNSIYENKACAGKDIFLVYLTYDCHIYLDKASRIVPVNDRIYMAELRLSYHTFVWTVDILQETLPPYINHDLYVAPWGDDSNSGLSFADPLKSVYYVTSVIASDSLNPKSIFLAPGLYSRETQEFPFTLPDNVNLIGAGTDETVINEGGIGEVLFYPREYGNIEVKNFSITRGGNLNNTYSYALLGFFANTMSISNIHITNNNQVSAVLLRGESVNLENITIKNSSGSPLQAQRSSNVCIENVMIDNNRWGRRDNSNVYLISNENLLVNNLSYTNSINYYSTTLFNVQYEESYIPGSGLVTLNNVLIANNFTQDLTGWHESLISICRRNRTILNNWTVANNRGAPHILTIWKYPEEININNSIFNNPDALYEINCLDCEVPNIPITFNNSLIYENRVLIGYNQNNVTFNNVIHTAPIFAGEFDESLTPAKMEYYQLHSTSPAIDSGLLDISETGLPAYDLAGNQRIHNGRVDMGAFEYGAEPYVKVNDESVPPLKSYNLLNFPNPVNLSKNPNTIITFDYDKNPVSEPEIEIYNIKGQKIRTLKTGISFYDLAVKAGLSKESLDYIKTRNYSARWDMKDENKRLVASGVYFYRAKVDGKMLQTKKMMVIK
jgi:hypothetical protein